MSRESEKNILSTVDNIISTVENFLNENNIKNKNIILGFSSGPDSTALALIVNELKEKLNLNITLAYFNHGWREEAKEEEFFTKEFAKKYGFNVIIKKAPKNSLKTEEIARELRYEFFENCAKKQKTDVVLLAHNKNDNIETLVYRVIKGTSIKGLCAIPSKRGIYYRPLLEVLKSDILEFLNIKNQEYKIDLSNKDTKYKRNLIREEILPMFEKINPNYVNNIEILIKNAISTREIVEKELNELKNEVFNGEILIQDKFLSKTKAQRYEILNDFLGDNLKYRNYKNIKKFDDFILENKHSKISVNKKLFLEIKKNKIYYKEAKL